MKSTMYLFLVFVFSLFNNSIAQTAVIDSLKRELANMPDDTIKTSLLRNICGQYRSFDAKEAVKYGKKALELSIKLKHNSSIIKSYYMVAASFMSEGNVDSCIYYAKKAEKLALDINDNMMLGNIYNIFSNTYRSISDNENALKYAFKSVELTELLEDSIGQGYAYFGLGNIYWEKYDTANAKKFYLKALDKLKNAKDSSSLPAVYMGLYTVVNNDEKFEYLKKAEEIALKRNDISSLSYIYSNMGAFNIDVLKDYNKAAQYLYKALYYSRKIGDTFIEGQILSNFGSVFIKLDQKDSAIYYISKSLEKAGKNGDIHEILDNYFSLYELYKANSNSDSALYYLELNNNIKDSLYNAGISQKNAEANAKYETEKKEAEIVKQKLQIALEKKRKNRILFGGIILLLITGLGFQWFVNRQRRKNKETELALKLKDVESKNLKELNDAKSRFFANITHEFRTPLTLIMGPLQDAIGKVKGNTKETLKIAYSNSQKLLALVNDILDLSTMEEGSPELNMSNACLFAFLKRLFYSYESYAKVRQVSTGIILPKRDDVPVYTDLEKLEKIINNLLSNAFKYTDTGGSIKMIVDVKENIVFISIQDTGVGIDKKDIDHIFDRYYQGQNAENITGTGIGLSFADRLAKMLGGKIDVKSKKGKGSTFTLQLPVDTSKDCPEDLKEIENETKESDVAPSTYKVKTIFADKPKILIVEDNYEMQKYLSSILEEYFYVEIAENGFEGLKKLKENKYDLISSDVMMPGMDGFVFRQEINKNPEWRNLPFILLTARSLKEDKLRGFKLGVDDYITKPFNAIEYVARINNLIKNKLERDKWINEKLSDNDIPKEKQIDHKLIIDLEKIILENIDNPDFNVSELATSIGYSQRNLSRITKKIIGMTPVNLILEVRLQKAYQLLKSNKYKTISEVRYEVGIDNASYFTRKFVERFGVKPGEVR